MQSTNIHKSNFPVKGMHCSGCARSVELILKSIPGVIDASVSFEIGTASVEYDATKLSPKDMQKEVKQIGYDLVAEQEQSL